MQEHVKREKEVQAECASRHIVNLVASYKDAAYLYMLLECIMGGELFTYMQVSQPGSASGPGLASFECFTVYIVSRLMQLEVMLRHVCFVYVCWLAFQGLYQPGLCASRTCCFSILSAVSEMFDGERAHMA